MEVRGRTIQQLSPKKIAFAEQVPVQCSVSEAFHVRSNSDSIQMMKQLAASMPHVACAMNFLDSVSTEWRLYQADAADIYTTGMGTITKRP